MKRVLPIFLVLLSLSSMSQYLDESFESGDFSTGWTFETIVFPDAEWVVTNDASPGGHTGSYYARFQNSLGMAMVSPEMDLSTASNPYLSLWYYLKGGSYIRGIHYKTSASGEWVEIVGTMYEATNDWTELFVQLPEVSSTFYLAIDGCSYGSEDFYIDDIKVFNVSSGPEPTTVIFPTESQTNINTNNNRLIWNTPEGFPDGYKVYLGTDGGGVTTPSNLVNEAWVTDTTFEFTNLQANTNYYWQIVPSNTGGDATSCPIWSFTTSQESTINNFPWKEDFGTTSDLPEGWSNLYGESVKDWSVESFSSWGVYNDHSSNTDEGSFIMVDASVPNEMSVSIATPIIDLSTLVEPHLSFWYNSLYGEYGPSILHIDVYNGVNWQLDVLIVNPDDSYSYFWKPYVIDLSTYASNATIVRFRSELGYSVSSDIHIDDVKIYEGSLECISNMLPDNNEITLTNGILSWDQVSGAEGYILCLGSDGEGIGEPSNIEYYTDLGNVTEYNYTGLDNFEDYYWVVYAYNSESYSELCSIQHFSTDNTLAVNHLSKEDMRIFPNPNSGRFVIEGGCAKSIQLIDVTGEVIKDYSGLENVEQIKVDISVYPKGLYLLKIEQEKNSYIRKIIVE